MADDVLRIVTTSPLQPGGTGQVAIVLENTTEFSAFQFDIALSDGLAVAQNEGKWGLTLTSRAPTHQLTARVTADGNLRVAGYSMPTAAFIGQTGALLLVDISVSEDCEGEGSISLRNIRFTTTGVKEIKFNDVTQTLTIGCLKGDANGDNTVSIADAVAVVDYILTNGQPTGNFVFGAANMDDDEAITIADAIAIVNIILNK